MVLAEIPEEAVGPPLDEDAVEEQDASAQARGARLQCDETAQVDHGRHHAAVVEDPRDVGWG